MGIVKNWLPVVESLKKTVVVLGDTPKTPPPLSAAKKIFITPKRCWRPPRGFFRLSPTRQFFTIPIILLVGVAFWITACGGGRLPTTAKSQAILRKHFNHYGKEYRTSPFGNKRVTNVEILEAEEIHKHLVSLISFLTVEGPEVFKVRVVVEKGPFGWRYVSWENLSGG